MRTTVFILATGLLASTAMAQTTSPSSQSNVSGSNAAATTNGASVVNPSETDNGLAKASGDSNQAVSTTSANAVQPAKGSNSFTEGEARHRIETEGFATVTDLKLDDEGVWRGHANKNGAKVGVWLDYKGNVGLQ